MGTTIIGRARWGLHLLVGKPPLGRDHLRAQFAAAPRLTRVIASCVAGCSPGPLPAIATTALKACANPPRPLRKGKAYKEKARGGDR